METPDIISTILREKQLDVQGLSAKTEVSDKDLYKMINGYTKTMGIKTANKINAVFPEYSIEFLRKKKDNLENKESDKNSSEFKSADRFEDIVAHKVIQRQKKDMDYLKERISELNEKLNQLLVEREVILEQELSSKKKLTDS